jgi:hypothetical protein
MTSTTFALALATVGLLAAPAPSRAMCERFGTQLECRLGPGRLSLGTQRDADPAYASALRPHTFHPGGSPFDETVRTGTPHIELQNVGRDPGLCRRFGDETYCY